MKKLLLSALLAGATLPAMAQFVPTPGKSNSSPTSFPTAYDRFSVGYNANLFSGKGSLDEGYTMHGIAAQYTHGWAISKSAPFYIDMGVRLDFGFYSTDDKDITGDRNEDIKLMRQKLSATIPVNIAYGFQLSNGATITPYTGFHLKANLMARQKYDLDTEWDTDGAEDWVNLLDKKDMEKWLEDIAGVSANFKNDEWQRFQFGWQIGLGFSKGAFNIGVEYGIDFGELTKKETGLGV